MQTLLTFTSAGWDFTNETANGINDYWRMCTNSVDYPRLNWQSIDGDFTCPDGVNTEDLTYYTSHWLMDNCTSANNYCGGVDLDYSGAVDLTDFAIFAAQWLNGTEGTVSVPDVSDMSQENAEAAIIAAGLAVGTVSEAFSETVAMGYVISQFPSAGQFVLLDSSVDIVVSKGPAPISPDVVLIPGGTFSMGDNFNEGNVNERPVHTVTLDSFYMGKYEITNQQYCDFLNWADDNGWITVTSNIVYKADTSYPYCDTHASSTYSQIAYSGGVFSVLAKAGRSMANDPMVRISWYGAVAYCNWRSQQEGKESCYNLSTWEYDFSKKGYHLPTEAEWEYAARGGLGSKRFPWGDTITQTQANFKSSSAYPYDISIVKNIFHPLWNDGTNSYTAPVGFFDGTVKYKIDYNWPSSDTSYQTTSGANGYGLYDMAGNVYEWCNDWYSDTYYESSPELNPLGPTTGTYRTIRSSSWIHNAFYCRVAQRQPTHPEGRNDTGGFRIALGY